MDNGVKFMECGDESAHRGEHQYHISTLMGIVLICAIVCYIYRFYDIAMLMFIVSIAGFSSMQLFQVRQNRIKAENERLRKLVLNHRDQDRADDERFGRFGRSE